MANDELKKVWLGFQCVIHIVNCHQSPFWSSKYIVLFVYLFVVVVFPFAKNLIAQVAFSIFLQIGQCWCRYTEVLDRGCLEDPV